MRRRFRWLRVWAMLPLASLACNVYDASLVGVDASLPTSAVSTTGSDTVTGRGGAGDGAVGTGTGAGGDGTGVGGAGDASGGIHGQRRRHHRRRNGSRRRGRWRRQRRSGGNARGRRGNVNGSGRCADRCWGHARLGRWRRRRNRRARIGRQRRQFERWSRRSWGRQQRSGRGRRRRRGRARQWRPGWRRADRSGRARGQRPRRASGRRRSTGCGLRGRIVRENVHRRRPSRSPLLGTSAQGDSPVDRRCDRRDAGNRFDLRDGERRRSEIGHVSGNVQPRRRDPDERKPTHRPKGALDRAMGSDDRRGSGRCRLGRDEPDHRLDHQQRRGLRRALPRHRRRRRFGEGRSLASADDDRAEVDDGRRLPAGSGVPLPRRLVLHVGAAWPATATPVSDSV